jgi:hypothetical protein
MNEKLRIYFYFVFGSIGGLTGWFLSASLLTNIITTLQQATYGAIVGAVIGLAIAAYEGFATRSLTRLFKYGSIGLMLGTVAGVVALPVSFWLYSRLINATKTIAHVVQWKSIAVGMVCWVLFGGLIGFVEGLNKGTQSIKGFTGGVLGGLIGGGIYESARVYGIAETASFKQQMILAVSLSILGGAIGASIALVTVALKQAWVEVLDGKYAGRVYDVTKYIDPRLGRYKPGIIGSDEWSSNIYLPFDPKVYPSHAKIGYADGAPYLSVFPEAQKNAKTMVNGKDGFRWVLDDGALLQIGGTLLIYKQKRK